MESKSLQKNTASLSLIFGILAVIFFVIFIGLQFGLLRIPYVVNLIAMSKYIILFVIIPGIIFGILGLKSTKKNFAIAGIILSLLPVIYLIGFFLYMGRFI